MRRHRIPASNEPHDPLLPIVRLWLLRLLVPLGGHKDFVASHGFANDELAAALGLEEWLDPDGPSYDQHAIRKTLWKEHAEAERHARRAAIPKVLRANTTRLANLVGLSKTDCRILEFAVLIHNERLLDDAADLLGGLSSAKTFRVLADLLDLPERAVRNALSSNGLLARSGLLTLYRRGHDLLRAKLDLLSDDFGDQLFTCEADPVELVHDMIAPSRSPTLTLENYTHITAFLDVLRPYLEHAVATHRPGVNVFVYGPPGTGKTELARLMAKTLGHALFEVASEDKESDPINGERRLRAFRAAQSFLAQQSVLLLFDEVDDVFDDASSLFGPRATAQTRKGWVNRMLEDNPVPTIWIANSVDSIDPAFIRRFDLVFELPIPARSQRARILSEHVSPWLNTRAISRLAESEDLAPAVITRAASVLNAIDEQLEPAEAGTAFEQMVNHTLRAQRLRPLPRASAGTLPEVYDAAFIHADTDLAAVARGLAEVTSGRLCLYGPPGTGKTAFAYWLAETLDRPLLVRRASDLLSMWLGESEKQMAEAFHQAERENALLLIDEVDSFLQDRGMAQRSWEISLVNEMLTQMESFPGLFMASTNRMDGLDPASLRRFDLKVHFDYLRTDQAQELFRRWCRTWGIGKPTAIDLAAFRHLDNLTPGDYATVARRHRFQPLQTPAEGVAALVEECALKDGGRGRIGFRPAA